MSFQDTFLELINNENVFEAALSLADGKPRELARVLDVSLSSARRYIAAGHIISKKIEARAVERLQAMPSAYGATYPDGLDINYVGRWKISNEPVRMRRIHFFLDAEQVEIVARALLAGNEALAEALWEQYGAVPDVFGEDAIEMASA